MSLEERQRRRRAAGRVGPAALIDAACAHSASMGEFCEWLLAQPRRDAQTVVDLLSEMRAAIVAVKILRCRRELADLLQAVDDDPRWRGRIAEVTGRLRVLERTAGATAHPWGEIIEREETAPARRPRPAGVAAERAGGGA